MKRLHAFALAGLIAGATSMVVMAADENATPAPPTAPEVTSQAEPAPEAGAGEHKFELAKQYYGQCKGVSADDFENIRTYMKAFTDAEAMAETMADPVRFFQLVNIVNDPRTIHVMMKCSTEPVMWDTWMRGATDYEKMTRAMMRFANPGMVMAWMMAPMNPQVWKPVAEMADPNRYMVTWAQALANPTFYDPMLAPLDPAWQQKRIDWFMNPASFQPFFQMFNAFAGPATSMFVAPQAATVVAN